MLKDWRIWLLSALVVLIAIWLYWWSSLGFPPSHEICSDPKTHEDCENYNIVFYSAWAFGKAIDHWSALITAVATGAIGYFTLTLKRSTDNLWKSGEKQIAVAKEAADAAKLNAEALISAERAQLFVIVKTDNLLNVLRGSVFYRETESMHDSRIPRAELEFTIKNTGRTAAIMQDVSYQIIQADADTTMWQYTYRDTIVNAALEGGNETSPPTPCSMETDMTLADGVAVIDEDRPIFFYGFIIFRDTFKHRHQYFWRHEYRGRRFVLVHEEEHQLE